MKRFKLAHQTMNYRTKNRLVVAKMLKYYNLHQLQVACVQAAFSGGTSARRLVTGDAIRLIYPTGNTKKAKHILYNNQQ